MYIADIAVVGAGTAGCACALAAARCGLDVILTEQTGMVGGAAASALMGSWANLLMNTEGKRTTGGIILEILERMVRQGGTPYAGLEEAVRGRIGKPFTIPFQPVWYTQALAEMLEEEGVRLLLNTVFTDAWELADGRKRLHFAFGTQRLEVCARVVVDATGNADVAESLGARVYKLGPDATTYGCLMRIANADMGRTLAYVREREPWRGDAEFGRWLEEKRKEYPEDTRRRLSYLDDPVTYDHAPMGKRGENVLTPERFAYVEERYREERVIYTLELCLLRHLIRQAADKGDFLLDGRVDDARGVTFNGDGLACGGWGEGIVLCNVAKPYGFDPADAEERTRAILEARKYNVMVFRFLKKYVPGFEDSFLLDMGGQAVARAGRMIVGCDDAQSAGENPLYAQPIYIFGGIYDYQPGSPVPYGKIVSRNRRNLFAVGKCSSRGQQYRSQISCMSMGVAAAAAAKLICESDCDSHTLEPAALARQLEQMGVII